MDDIIEFLEKVHFEKQLKKLKKKLKNKTIVVYGTGLLFQQALKNYDFSGLNIIGVSDKKYSPEDEGKDELGFKVIPLDKIEDYKPDYILLGVRNFLPVMEDFVNDKFYNTKIRIIPLADKPFMTLLAEVFS